MRWVVETDKLNEGYKESMIEAFEELDCEYQFVDYIPFQKQYDALPYFNEFVIIYGSLGLLESTQFLPKVPGVGTTFRKYACSYYYPILHEHLLNNQSVWIPFSLLAKNNKWPREDSGSGARFVRPDTTHKLFTGGVYTLDEIAEMYNLLTEPQQLDNTMVLIDWPRGGAIQYEWRFYVVGGKIITYSMYRKNGKKYLTRQTRKAALEKAQQIVQLYRPDDCFCIDICLYGDLEYSEYRVVEISPLHCAGLYAADVKKLIKAMHNFYTDRWEA